MPVINIALEDAVLLPATTIHAKLKHFAKRHDGFKKEYRNLDIDGKKVVDVGAYTGDTAIYFAENGAEHVYAYEPSPALFKAARENIDKSPYKDRVSLFNDGVAGDAKDIVLSNKDIARNNIWSAGLGEKVKLTTLDAIVKKNNIREAELKMDCEGYEYSSMLSASPDTLRRFSKMAIEYHHGYANLKKKLESCGFRVSVTKPHYFIAKKMLIGFLYAER